MNIQHTCSPKAVPFHGLHLSSRCEVRVAAHAESIETRQKTIAMASPPPSKAASRWGNFRTRRPPRRSSARETGRGDHLASGERREPRCADDRRGRKGPRQEEKGGREKRPQPKAEIARDSWTRAREQTAAEPLSPRMTWPVRREDPAAEVDSKAHGRCCVDQAPASNGPQARSASHAEAAFQDGRRAAAIAKWSEMLAGSRRSPRERAGCAWRSRTTIGPTRRWGPVSSR